MFFSNGNVNICLILVEISISSDNFKSIRGGKGRVCRLECTSESLYRDYILKKANQKSRLVFLSSFQ